MVASQDNPELPPPLRNENGQLLPGNTANKAGVNGHTKGWQPLGIRLQKWLNMSAVEIADMHKDEARLYALSSIDAMCIKMISGGFTAAPKDMVKIFKEINDRIEGTPRQTITITNPRPEEPESVKQLTDEQITERYRNQLMTP